MPGSSTSSVPPGADLVLLLAVLHPPARLAELVAQARDLGLEPLIEAHDAREIEAALAAGARLVGVNNRDLRTLDVDPEQAVRLRDLIPGDRLAIAESGVRDAATVARWRATGYDAALVGESLMRSPDPAAAARAYVAAGRDPTDPTADARAPFVKICGVTDAAGILAAVRAGADAIGLNFAPGTPRALSIEEGVELAKLARASASAERPAPRIVLVTADLPTDEMGRIMDAVDPDAIQLSGDEPPSVLAALGRPAWKALRGRVRQTLRTPSSPSPARTSRPARPESCSTPPAGRTRAAPACASTPPWPPRSPGRCRSRSPAACTPATSRPRCSRSRRSASTSPRARTRPRDGRRPHKDPLRVAMFTKRARDARRHRPNLAFGPTPVHAGLLEADGAGRWGKERDFGGRYVPETLVAALEQLESAYDAVRHDPRVLGRARRPARALRRPPDAAVPGGPPRRRRAARLRCSRASGAAKVPQIPAIRLYLKREDLAHTGAHKINNALGQALLTRRLGKTRVIAETGAGQHGVATATACALLGLPCVVFMGEEDIRRQAPERAPDARPGRRGPLASRPGRRRSRTPSTRRCATG